VTISFENVGLAFGDKPPLFDLVDFSVESGQFVLIQGPSGSGKSSFLKLINRLSEPTRGSILVDGKMLTELPVLEHRRSIAYLQQVPVMLDGTVRYNLLLPFGYAVAKGVSKPSDAELQSYLDRLLLNGIKLDEDALKLSVGQQQRVALIRLLLTHPKMLLCDEPTSALDPESRGIVEDLLERLVVEDGLAVVMVTHLEFPFKSLRPRIVRIEPETGLQEVSA
jgi:putative ABC transport system ATP-binding protein